MHSARYLQNLRPHSSQHKVLQAILLGQTISAGCMLQSFFCCKPHAVHTDNCRTDEMYHLCPAMQHPQGFAQPLLVTTNSVVDAATVEVELTATIPHGKQQLFDMS